MLKKTMLTLTVLGSLVIALPSQARDRDDDRYEVQQTHSYAYNQHNSHQPRVVFYFSNQHQPYGNAYGHHYRQDNHHYRHHDRQHYRHYDRHDGGHYERRYDRH